MLLSSCDTLTRSSSSFDPQSDLVDIGKVRKSEDEEPVILLHIILVVTNK